MITYYMKTDRYKLLKSRFVYYIAVSLLTALFTYLLVVVPNVSKMMKSGACIYDRYSLTDLYYSIFYASQDSTVQQIASNPEVIIVDMQDIYGRDSLAECISQVSSCNPRAIGIDIAFNAENYDSADSLLCQAIKSDSRIVVVQRFYKNDDGADYSFSQSFFSNASTYC